MTRRVKRRRPKGSGTIVERKRADGTSVFQVRYPAQYSVNPETGKRRISKFEYVTLAAANRKDAEQELDAINVKVRSNQHVQRDRITLDAWFREHFLALYARGTAKTLETYENLFSWYVVPTLGTRQLQDLTATDIRELFLKLSKTGRRKASTKGNGLSVATLRSIHRILHMTLEAAIEPRLIPHNPVPTFGKLKLASNTTGQLEAAQESVRRKALDVETAGTLLEALSKAKSDLFLLTALLLETGLRRSEGLALRWSDIDVGSCQLRVERSLECTQGQIVGFKAPKTAAGRRTVGIGETLAKLLSDELERQKTVWYLLQTGQEEIPEGVSVLLPEQSLVFPANKERPAEPWHPDYISRKFRRRVETLGFKGVSLHALRHTSVSVLIKDGVPATDVQKRVGHSTPQVTMSIYAHALEEVNQQATQSGSQFLSQLGQKKTEDEQG